jgi:hypothetical protein
MAPLSIESALRIPAWASDDIRTFGMTLVVLGVMAVAVGRPGGKRRRWGRRVTLLGVTFMIVGYGTRWVAALLRYAVPG